VTPEQIWNVLGGVGEAPPRLGRYAGPPLLIIGGGRTVWEDFAKVRPWGGEIMAVNDVGMHLHDRVRHWVTLHPEYMAGWRYYREKHLYGQGNPAMCHSYKDKEGIDCLWRVGNLGGTSGLFACFVGLMLGYTDITLAGIPMNNDGHYFDPPWQRTDFADKAVEIVWKQAALNIFAGRVKSLSGKTREWLGTSKHEKAAIAA
jgi:hypothetical protein